MPPIIALIICSIFVAFLLCLERKQLPTVSRALWIPTIWMLLNLSKPLGIWIGSSGVSMEEGSDYDRLALSVLFLIGFLILTTKNFQWSKSIREYPTIYLIVGFTLLSVSWSDMPFVSFKRWTREIIAVAIAFVIGTESNPWQAVQCIFRRSIYILIPFSYVLIHYYPVYGRMYTRWSGETMWVGAAGGQKNGLAVLCLFAIFFLIWSLVRRWRGCDEAIASYQNLVEIFLLMLSIWLFLGPEHTLTNSATSTVALGFGLIMFAGLHFLKTLRAARVWIIIVVLIIVFGTIMPFTGASSLTGVSATFGRDETLTGRTEIWAYLVPYATQKLFLGYGFGGFWTEAIREKTSSHAHNGYLDLILNTGLFGHILFSMFLLSLTRRFQKILVYDFDFGAFSLCLLLMAVVHNITESSMTSFSGLFGASLLFMMVATNSDQLSMMEKKAQLVGGVE